MDEIRKKARRLNDALYTLDRVYQENERKRGYKDSEICMVYALDDGEFHSQKEISEEREIPRTTLNTIVKEWERQGYLELRPIPGKRRDMQIVLTEAGERYARPCLNYIYQAEDYAMKKTLEKYSDTFIEALECFHSALQEAMQNPKEE